MRTVILASDDSEMIKNYPYVAWAWNELGWNTHLFYLGKDSVLLNEYKKVINHFNTSKNTIHRLPQMEGFENDVILGVAKLFGGYCFWDDRILMTADIDIIPTAPCYANLFNRNKDVSACKYIDKYTAMRASLWREKIETGKWRVLPEKNVGGMFENEFINLLHNNSELKSVERVDRIIALNKLIIDAFIPKGYELGLFHDQYHIKLDPTSETNNLMNIENILRTNFNKVPAWM